MSVSLFQISVPVFSRFLHNLAAILEQAEAHAAAQRIEPAVLLDSRLFPDMFPLARQIQRTIDIALNGAGRLAGLEQPPQYEGEATFAAYRAGIQAALAFLNSLEPEQIDGAEQRSITITRRGETTTVLAQTWLLHNVLPNFYFHLTTAYDLLRHNGVALGKKDFIG
jgi:uncharacterized protein